MEDPVVLKMTDWRGTDRSSALRQATWEIACLKRTIAFKNDWLIVLGFLLVVNSVVTVFVLAGR